MAQRRSGDELASVADPAWPALRDAFDTAEVDVVVLPLDERAGRAQLEALQVSAASTLGAMALHCGGLIGDHGWFRLLGGGCDRLLDLASANDLPAFPASPPGSMLVGWDALGGRFAIDGGALDVKPGEVCYFGPDTLTWDGLGGGYTAFVHTLLAGGLAEATGNLRWPGWQAEVEHLAGDQGISLYPPAFSVEGRDLASASRRAVPITELFTFYDDVAAQLLR
jgi:hypothetical protein